MLKTKHGLSFVAAVSSMMLLVACGDDNSTKASDKIVVDSVEDLSNCVATKVGNLEYVDTVAYVCVELGDKIKWVQVAGVEDNSEDFRACTGKKDGLYSFSPKENTLYVCNDEEWVPVKQLDDNDSMEEFSSSSAKSSSSSSAKSSSSEKSSSSTKSSSSEAKSSSSSVTPKSSSSETSVSSSSEAKSSSSSVTPQSSSSEKAESSSSKVTEPAEVTTGTMTDSRDGQTYKTVTIGTQTWMAQNLNYAYTDVPYKRLDYTSDKRLDYTSDSTSWCYNDDANNCSKYGRLYTWAAAMDSVGTWSTNGKGCGYNKTCSPTYPVRGVCPEGWHLPTKVEFETLFTAVGGLSTAGKVLRSTSGWYNSNSGNGSDAFAFSALPAGYRNSRGYYNDEGNLAYFWYLVYDNVVASLNYYYNGYGFSVRCLKD